VHTLTLPKNILQAQYYQRFPQYSTPTAVGQTAIKKKNKKPQGVVFHRRAILRSAAAAPLCSARSEPVGDAGTERLSET